jgi:hypothetical protein
MHSNSRRQSAADLAAGLTLSNGAARSNAPERLTRPQPGLSAVTPQNAAGSRIDPPVSEPSAIGTMPAATAAAEPEDEPPVIRSGSQGLRHRP